MYSSFVKLVSKILLRKDITLTRNCVIRIFIFCIQNTPVPPISGYF